jgi:hypothetical protein
MSPTDNSRPAPHAQHCAAQKPPTPTCGQRAVGFPPAPDDPHEFDSIAFNSDLAQQSIADRARVLNPQQHVICVIGSDIAKTPGEDSLGGGAGDKPGP